VLSVPRPAWRYCERRDLVGAILGLVFGSGALLVWRSGPRAPKRRQRTAPSINERVAELLTQAGYTGVRPQQLYAVSAALGVIVFVVVAGVSRAATIGIAFAGFAGYAPFALVRHRRRLRSTELREVWPDVVDNLASAVRAGMALPEAVAQIAVRGPTQLRPAFQGYAEDYRATGRFGDCLDRLKLALADPTGDRIVESMRVAREVGGTDRPRPLVHAASTQRLRRSPWRSGVLHRRLVPRSSEQVGLFDRALSPARPTA
jgi:tight adherence protein B